MEALSLSLARSLMCVYHSAFQMNVLQRLQSIHFRVTVKFKETLLQELLLDKVAPSSYEVPPP